ncbi:hypothetical protein A2767_05850 [Candidatus Roizmanbacteria bacterium RIFCSPHIGHO2_01_FULL_35_10]|nr:MAG: hypothetical protein A2767_05850 [Candidatus Roizmanbacteria bacterium RIFCSPHIGHO2_01_FULL_35_10]
MIGVFVWDKFKKPFSAFFAALLGGVLIDFDHLYDYFVAFGFSFDLNSFLSGNYFEINNKIIVPFHAWEWVFLLLILYLFLSLKSKSRIRNKKLFVLPIILALALGISSHLIFDTIANHMLPQSYFLTYRIMNRYTVQKMVTLGHYEKVLKEGESK